MDRGMRTKWEDYNICKSCAKAQMITIQTFHPTRAPPVLMRRKGGYTGKVRITKEKLCENTHGGNANALCENLIEEKGS